MSDPVSDETVAPSPYMRTRVDETRISRTYAPADIAELIKRDLLQQTSRSYKEIAREGDAFSIDIDKLPDAIAAQLVMQGRDY